LLVPHGACANNYFWWNSAYSLGLRAPCGTSNANTNYNILSAAQVSVLIDIPTSSVTPGAGQPIRAHWGCNHTDAGCMAFYALGSPDHYSPAAFPFFAVQGILDTAIVNPQVACLLWRGSDPCTIVSGWGHGVDMNTDTPLSPGIGFPFIASHSIGLQAEEIFSLICNPAGIVSNSSSSCGVTLSQPAPSGGADIILTNSDANLAVPGSVTVPAADSQFAFTVTTGTVSSNQTATITASYNGSSASTSVSLVAAASGSVIVSALTCNATQLTSGSSTACRVSLNTAAPVGGATVILTSNSAALTVPTSITVPAGEIQFSFSARAGAIIGDLMATVSATLNQSRVATEIALAELMRGAREHRVDFEALPPR
jgi:hypothetical protein